jgi:hypothetical protein
MVSSLESVIFNILVVIGTIVSTALGWALILVGPALCFLAIRSRSTPRKMLLLGACMLYGVLPLLLGVIGTSLATALGCQAEMGLNYQCPTHSGLEDSVTTMIFIGAWGPIVTIPSSALGLLGVVISYITLAVRNSSR